MAYHPEQTAVLNSFPNETDSYNLIEAAIESASYEEEVMNFFEILLFQWELQPTDEALRSVCINVSNMLEG